MKVLDLTVEQVNFICAVIDDDENASRGSVIDGIFKILPDITDKEMIAVAEKTVAMLEAMTDEDFAECHFPEIKES